MTLRTSQSFGVDLDVRRGNDEKITEVDYSAACLPDFRGELSSQIGESPLNGEDEHVSAGDVSNPVFTGRFAVEDTEYDTAVGFIVDLALDGAQIEVELAHERLVTPVVK